MTRRLLGVVGLLLVGVGVLGVVNLFQARSLANGARADILAAVTSAENGEFATARAGLTTAVDRLDTAIGRIDSPWASLVGALPYVHTEIRAGAGGIAAVREDSLAILDILDFVLADRPPLFERGRIDPNAVAWLETSLGTALDHATAARRAIDDAPSPRLGAIRGSLVEVDDTTAALMDVLSGGRTLVARITEAATGGEAFRVLVLFENEAELRATGGLIGFLALLEIDDGEVTLSRIHRSGLRDPTGGFVSVDTPADYLRRYGEFRANTTLWLNVNMSPDFPTVADIAGRLYEGVTGIRPDLVVRVDLVALGYLLEAFPGITVDGVPLEPDTLATSFLIDSYNRFSEAGQDVFVASVVRQVFDQVLGGAGADMTVLVNGLRRAVRERRIAFFTDDGAVDGLFARAGVDGRVLPGAPGDVEVVVQNFAANKIDIFTATAISVDIDPIGCLVDGEVTITLENRLPDGAEFPSDYGFGGTGRWWVSFYLPTGAEIVDLSVDGEPSGGTTDIELGRPVASMLVRAEPGDGTAATVRWQEEITGPEYRLRMQPQPLVVPATLSIGGGAPTVFLETKTVSIPTDCKR